MTTFLDLAKSRHSVRHYETKPVELEKLTAILEAGRIAPTAANQQPCRFLVLNDPQSIAKVKKACNPHGAPLVIIICADKHNVWVRPFDKASMADIDSSIATDHMMLCAQDLGLASCWITYFKPDTVRQEFNLPQELVPINILAVGYSTEPAKPHTRYNNDRNTLEDIVQYASY